MISLFGTFGWDFNAKKGDYTMDCNGNCGKIPEKRDEKNHEAVSELCIDNALVFFHDHMKERMYENKRRPGWFGCSTHYLMNEAIRQLDQINEGEAETIEETCEALVDAANYLMMMYDIISRQGMEPE